MILDILIQGFFGIFTALFTIFPDFPPMPSLITEGFNWFIQFINSAMGVLVYFLSKPLYMVALALIIFMTTFHYVYQFFIRFIILRIALKFAGR